MPKKLDAGKLVRGRARKVIGTVPGTRVIADKRHKPEKHKVNYLRHGGRDEALASALLA